MIIVPKCFRCSHYKDGKCPAHPNGIPRDVLSRKHRDEDCGTNIRYEKRVSFMDIPEDSY